MKTSIVAVAVMLCSCATIPTPPSDITRVSGPSFDGVIFSATFAQRTGVYILSVPRWTPTPKQVLRFEGAITAYVSAHASHVLAKLPSHKRQYVGLVEEKTGRRQMQVRLFCERDLWDRTPFLMDDGADCNCEAHFDPESSQVVWFGCAGS